MTNPAGARWQLVGVYEKRWVRPLAEAFANLGSKHTLVVHSEDGLDEISIAAPTTVCEFRDGTLSDYEFSPEDHGVERQALDLIRVDDASGSLTLIREALGGTAGPAYDMVALNAGATIYVADLADSLDTGIERAREVLDSGSGLARLEEMVAYSQRFEAA